MNFFDKIIHGKASDYLVRIFAFGGRVDDVDFEKQLEESSWADVSTCHGEQPNGSQLLGYVVVDENDEIVSAFYEKDEAERCAYSCIEERFRQLSRLDDEFDEDEFNPDVSVLAVEITKEIFLKEYPEVACTE